MSTLNIIGWSIMVLGWGIGLVWDKMIPRHMNNNPTTRNKITVVQLALFALATGIFAANAVVLLGK